MSMPEPNEPWFVAPVLAAMFFGAIMLTVKHNYEANRATSLGPAGVNDGVTGLGINRYGQPAIPTLTNPLGW